MFLTLLKHLDLFLAPETRASSEACVRGRAFVLVLLLGILVFAILLLNEGAPFLASLVNFIFLTAHILCLFGTKKGYSLERMMLGIAFLSASADIVDILWGTRSLSSISYVWDPVVIVFTFLICSSFKIRSLALMIMLLANGICYTLANRIDLNLSVPSETKLMMLPANLFLSFVLLLVIWVYLHLKNLAQRQLEREVEWQIRSTRLAEITSMTTTLHRIISRPFRDFCQKWQIFAETDVAVSGLDDSMLETLNDIVGVSQGLTWIYRAYQQDGASEVWSAELFKQLRILLSLKVKDEDWIIEAERLEESFPIYGEIPSLMLLLFSTAVQLMECQGRGDAPRTMRMSLRQRGNLIEWTFSWPRQEKEGAFENDAIQRAKPTLGRLRREFIDDLAQACKAKLDEFKDDSHHHVTITGSWHRP